MEIEERRDFILATYNWDYTGIDMVVNCYKGLEKIFPQKAIVMIPYGMTISDFTDRQTVIQILKDYLNKLEAEEKEYGKKEN